MVLLFWYCLLLFHTVKCTLTELTTKSFSILWKSMVFLYAHAREFYVLFVWEFLACALSANFQYCLEWQFIIQAVSPPLPSLFRLFIQCDRCLFPFPVWRHMSELPGFTSHGNSLHLGADCQQWELLVEVYYMYLSSQSMFSINCKLECLHLIL